MGFQYRTMEHGWNIGFALARVALNGELLDTVLSCCIKALKGLDVLYLTLFVRVFFMKLLVL